jgi:hypothetical protein
MFNHTYAILSFELSTIERLVFHKQPLSSTKILLAFAISTEANAETGASGSHPLLSFFYQELSNAHY